MSKNTKPFIVVIYEAILNKTTINARIVSAAVPISKVLAKLLRIEFTAREIDAAIKNALAFESSPLAISLFFIFRLLGCCYMQIL